MKERSIHLMSSVQTKEDFIEDYFMEITQDGKTIILRRDGSFSVYVEGTGQLLDFGKYSLDEPELLTAKYQRVGYMGTGKSLLALHLDPSNRRVLYAILRAGSDAVKIFISDNELPITEEWDTFFLKEGENSIVEGIWATKDIKLHEFTGFKYEEVVLCLIYILLSTESM